MNRDGAMVRSSPAYLGPRDGANLKNRNSKLRRCRVVVEFAEVPQVLMANREYLLGNIEKAVENGAKKTTVALPNLRMVIFP